MAFEEWLAGKGYNFGSGVIVDSEATMAAQKNRPRSNEFSVWHGPNMNVVSCENPDHVPSHSIQPYCKGSLNTRDPLSGQAGADTDARLPQKFTGSNWYWALPMYPGYVNNMEDLFDRRVFDITCGPPPSHMEIKGVYTRSASSRYDCKINHSRHSKYDKIGLMVAKVGADKINIFCYDLAGKKHTWPRKPDGTFDNVYAAAGSACEVVCKQSNGFNHDEEKFVASCSYGGRRGRGIFGEPIFPLAFIDKHTRQTRLDTYWGACKAN